MCVERKYLYWYRINWVVLAAGLSGFLFHIKNLIAQMQFFAVVIIFFVCVCILSIVFFLSKLSQAKVVSKVLVEIEVLRPVFYLLALIFAAYLGMLAVGVLSILVSRVGYSPGGFEREMIVSNTIRLASAIFAINFHCVTCLLLGNLRSKPGRYNKQIRALGFVATLASSAVLIFLYGQYPLA